MAGECVGHTGMLPLLRSDCRGVLAVSLAAADGSKPDGKSLPGEAEPNVGVAAWRC